MLTIKRIPEGGLCLGGVAVTEHIAFAVAYPAAIVEIWEDDYLVTRLSRDEAHDFSDAIVGCLLDG